MRSICITSVPASGKTFLAKKLAARLDVPVLHTDQLRQKMAQDSELQITKIPDGVRLKNYNDLKHSLFMAVRLKNIDKKQKNMDGLCFSPLNWRKVGL